jgi:hypothetical protein
MGPQILSLVNNNVFDLKNGFAGENISEADRCTLLAKRRREKPAKGHALLSLRVPNARRELVDKDQVSNGAFVKLGPQPDGSR